MDHLGQRIELAREAPLRVGAIYVEPGLRRVANDDGREALLEPRVMQVLVALVRAGGRIVSRDELAASCWHGVVVGEDALNRVIGRLRRVFDEVGDGELHLETITKVGYRLVAQDAPPAPRRQKPCVCVLPFANMSDDPQQGYFSEGVTDDIVIDLSKVSSLSVMGRSAALPFRSPGADVQQLARQLNVTHILEGSVRKAGGRVRVTAQLTDVASGDHVWGERWDRELTDIFAVQDEISQAVVGALSLRLAAKEKRAIEQRGTDSAEAYNLLLLARQLFVSCNPSPVRSTDVIQRLCERAIELDPRYARAWAMLALAQTTLRLKSGTPDDGLEAAEHALAIDPSLAEARAVRARHLFRKGRREEAGAEIDTALAQDPESYEVNLSAALLSFRKREFAKAVLHYEKAAALVESAFSPHGMLISCYAALGDTEGVRRSAHEAMARCEAALALDQTNGSALAVGVNALAALGELERARDWADRALLMDPDNVDMRYNMICALSRDLMDMEGALHLLELFLQTAVVGDINHLKVDPDLDPLREDRRFQAMVAAAEARVAAH
jgi:adenylate cyclase